MAKKHGRTIILEEDDFYILLKYREIELVDEGVLILFQKNGGRPIEEKEVKPFGDGGYHVTLGKEPGERFSTVFVVPAERIITDEKEVNRNG
ncbi:MAG: hypothetical protein HXS54_01435 [Theionarchaea archaeon]|nr:hypothetical protein [Theionarchaea archaeon]